MLVIRAVFVTVSTRLIVLVTVVKPVVLTVIFDTLVVVE